MMGQLRPPRETILQAYLAALLGALRVALSADTAIGSNTLLNVNVTAGQVMLGLPVFGPGIPPLSIVTNLSPLTISNVATKNASQASLTTGVVTSGPRVIPCTVWQL